MILPLARMSLSTYLSPGEAMIAFIGQAWKILNMAASEVGLNEVGTYTLRKIFGYHFYQI